MTQFKWGGEKREDKRITKSNLLIHGQAIPFSEIEKIFKGDNISTSEKKEKKQLPILAHDKFLVHRSAILTYKACPFKFFLEYAYEGHGLSFNRMSQSLLIGICVHRGLQHLFEHCRVHHPLGDFEEKCIDDAVAWGHEVFNSVLSERELSLKYGEDLNTSIVEIFNLIEALIRAYAAARLASFLKEYEVLEVEHEEVFDSFSPIVTWLGKADGLLRRKRDNALVLLSIKTASEFPESTMRNILIDMQGVSEIAAVEDRLNRLWREISGTKFVNEHIEIKDKYNITEELHKYLLQYPTEIKVLGNQYEYLIKGKQRKDPSNPSHYFYQTHLLHPIKTDSLANIGLSGLQFNASGGEYEWVIPTGRLAKGKRKINIYQDLGVKEWIAKLANLEVQPEMGNPFQNVIIAGEDRFVTRTREDIEEWRISTQFEAEEIAGRLTVLQSLERNIKDNENLDKALVDKVYIQRVKGIYKQKLQQFFRKDGRDSQICYNYYGGSCSFAAYCHENLQIEDGKESGLWINRTPHHEAEVERFKEKGFLEKDVDKNKD